MFTDNSDFYPTPPVLIEKMWNKLDEKDIYDIKYILEPQAGTGNIIDWIKHKYKYSNIKISAIEKDKRFVSILRDKDISIIDYDFLTFSGPDKFDLIIGNPPFSYGDLHLLKAIDIMYSGHIIYLLNAETLKNPYTNTRKILVKKLKELDADIEYINGAFKDPETLRKTNVEVALIHIHIEKSINEDLYAGITDAQKEVHGIEDIDDQKEIATKDSIHNMIADYNRVVNIGTQTLIDYFKNAPHVFKYIKIKVGEENITQLPKDLTSAMKKALNNFLLSVRETYWKEALTLDKVKEHMTVSKLNEFHEQLKENQYMDFTESNIRTFILNLIKNYDTILLEAVDEIFNNMTIKNAYHEELHTDNIHYFNGWKTNNAYKVNRKVVLPFYGNMSGAFYDVLFSTWKIDYTVVPKLNDIDKVMNYFDGRSKYVSIVDALEKGFAEGKTRKIKSTYFTISVFKKGTIHLYFNDTNVLRRFNITACKNRNWLPEDYGRKDYYKMDKNEQEIVKSFENKANYIKNKTTSTRLFKTKSLKEIGYIK